MLSAVITNIQGYSIHDGPGIRTVVFFKGCPLSCRWCANPECLTKSHLIGFNDLLCQHCGKCLETCRNEAIHLDDGEFRIDHSRCQECGDCVEACYYGALIQYGKSMTVEETWDAVRRDKMFYDASKGGVTVSGGEPLLNPAFVRILFERCHQEQIGTCVETCGMVSENGIREVIPVTDHFLFDLKHMDPDIHRTYTGHSNSQILKNARLVVESHVDIMFRLPLIPGINDTPANIEATAAFLNQFNDRARRLQLMPYHRMGQDKYRALNLEYSMKDLVIMENADLERIKNAYIKRGVDCSISQ